MANIFGPIEKLITEHGSAQIQRQRNDMLWEQLQIAKEQYEALERKNVELDRENKALQQKVARLEEDNDRLKQATVSPDDKTSGFTDDTHRMLVVFFNSSCPLTVDEVAARIGMKMPMAEYHLGLLREARMVRPTQPTVYGSRPPYKILQEGRNYVVRNRLREQGA